MTDTSRTRNEPQVGTVIDDRAGCVSNWGAAKRLRVQDQKQPKEKTYAIHDADDPQCLQRQ